MAMLDVSQPLASTSDPSALDQLIAHVQKQRPGFTFSLAGKADSHHQRARFTWHAAPPGTAEPVVVGFDVLLLQAGLIRSVYGFLDKVPG